MRGSQISMEWRSVLACKAINVPLKFKSQKDVCTRCCSNSSSHACFWRTIQVLYVRGKNKESWLWLWLWFAHY
uniref:Uncharacterized protein n=1 Tax=Phaseolus vulgaris TaxID=3885 RepID=V7CH67_PHAVU|nr:hypothetical protein PHAVU_002G078900g [Phaseolus vulgaris]ESW29547.1 hypothetical protein PHAVU_002G078900g [Phaseolus vulgaris]